MSRLIADIGGTNARFAFADGAGLNAIENLRCEDFASPIDAAKDYISRHGIAPMTGAFAVASALDGTDFVKITNNPWSFSINETQAALGLKTLGVINDFTAIAMSVPYLGDGGTRYVAGGEAQAQMPIAIIGPGTGLGTAGLVFAEGRYHVVTAEGGHVTMPAENARVFAIYEWLKANKYSHISAERVISGKGMVNLFNAINALDALGLPEKTPAEITAAAMDGNCAVSVEVLDLFCHFLGVVAGNLALSFGAFGGVYIAGGIVPQLGPYFDRSRFYEGFVAKGRYREYLTRINIRLITHPFPGLEGLKYL